MPLLKSLYEANGQLCPVSAEALGVGHDPKVCLRNWGLLLPVLHKAFAIDVTADEKTLLIGGGARKAGRESARSVLLSAVPLRRPSPARAL